MGTGVAVGRGVGRGVGAGVVVLRMGVALGCGLPGAPEGLVWPGDDGVPLPDGVGCPDEPAGAAVVPGFAPAADGEAPICDGSNAASGDGVGCRVVPAGSDRCMATLRLTMATIAMAGIARSA